MIETVFKLCVLCALRGDKSLDFFEIVAHKICYYHKREGYYDALSSRYKYSRILSTKMSSLEFEGLDDVFAQRKFK